MSYYDLYGNKLSFVYNRSGNVIYQETNKLDALKSSFVSEYVEPYISANGLYIDGASATKDEIHEYLLDKDNCKGRGKLYKNGVYLVDSNNKQVPIQGIGTHHLLQYTNIHTKAGIETLKYYGINCIRLTAYIENYSFASSDGQIAYGYASKKSETRAKMDELIQYCIDLGLYIIVDWHIYNATTDDVYNRKDMAVGFFDYFCNKWASYPNMIWEIANEPLNTSGTDLMEFVGACREKIISYDADAIMICGKTSDGSGNLWNALVSAGYDDVFVSTHNYGTDIPASFSGYKTIPTFNTEWGNSSYSGDGSGADDKAEALLDWYHQTGVPHCFWKWTDQTMATSILVNNGSINDSIYVEGGYTQDDLSDNGKLYLNRLKTYAFNDYIERQSIE